MCVKTTMMHSGVLKEQQRTGNTRWRPPKPEVDVTPVLLQIG